MEREKGLQVMEGVLEFCYWEILEKVDGALRE